MELLFVQKNWHFHIMLAVGAFGQCFLIQKDNNAGPELLNGVLF
jgi:hypothetical protein